MASPLRTVLAAASLGAAAVLGCASVAAADPAVPDGVSTPDAGGSELTGALAAADATTGAVGRLPLNPMANTGVDPLDNSVGTNVGGVPVSTAMVTGGLADGVTGDELIGRG